MNFELNLHLLFWLGMFTGIRGCQVKCNLVGMFKCIHGPLIWVLDIGFPDVEPIRILDDMVLDRFCHAS